MSLTAVRLLSTKAMKENQSGTKTVVFLVNHTQIYSLTI